MDATRDWAEEEFGRADLGDTRRTARLVEIAGSLFEHRAGKVTQTFRAGAEREGAYRLLENRAVLPESLVDAAGCACARRSRAFPFVVVPVDGTSATLADPHGKKDFGSVGTDKAGARGIKVISAIALSPAGEPLGLCAQQQWVRQKKTKKGKRRSKRRGRGRAASEMARARARKKARATQKRPVEQKETQHWIDVIRTTKCRFEDEAPETRCWFQIDREGDAWPVLRALIEQRTTDLFTVRATWNRRVVRSDGSPTYLRAEVEREAALGCYEVEVPAGKKRQARCAHMEIRTASTTLDARDQRSDKHYPLALSVVWAREVGTTPLGEEPLDWLLLTNQKVDKLESAQLVVDTYSMRWRIEDTHKTWQSGACRIQDSQLHTAAAVMKWSTLLFTVAVRVERIKHLARTSPDLPASAELSPHEIRALILLKRREKKRTETISDAMPTIGQAARWIADLGGYTGKSSGGPFGSITLARGFDRVVAGAEVLASLDDDETKM
jgi:Transposase DNA-binding/Transposase Tn5 dimerisation domain